MRILLADGQPKVRFALGVLLERQPGLELIGEAATAEDLLTQVQATCPELLLLEWELSGAVGAELLAALREKCPELVVIVLSGRMPARQAALAAGADAFVSKGDPPESLLTAISACSCSIGQTAHPAQREA